jgi:5'-nucleotidase / UDP-sugar diphosphatase
MKRRFMSTSRTIQSLTRVLPLALVIAVPAATSAHVPPGARPKALTAVTMLHFTDYHAHALPFYAEDRDGNGGIARLIGYLAQRAQEPGTLVFSGGDMMNLDVPSWSNKYPCVEWPWLNGIVDAMAYGNHDSEYGFAQFQTECLVGLQYPILSSNTYLTDGTPAFVHDGKTYRVFEESGVKIGVFAVAGPDFDALVQPGRRPYEGTTFGDRIQAARQVVDELRNVEEVAAVVLIGHSYYHDDLALAQNVPGIDLIFGSHSHLKIPLTTLPGTSTYYLSAYQYGTYIAEARMVFEDGALTQVTGQLTAMDASVPQDPDVMARVLLMQAELEADPRYAPLFVEIGEAAIGLSITGHLEDESVLGNLITDVLRDSAGSHLALATASTIREPIAPGAIIEEELRMALPYPNKIMVATMTGAQIKDLLDHSVSRAGSDFFSQVSGVRFHIAGGKAEAITVLSDPSDAKSAYLPLDPRASYQVATTDFQALIADGYRQHFDEVALTSTDIILRDQVRAYITANTPLVAALDGRITIGSPATEHPDIVPIQEEQGCGCTLSAARIGALAASLLLGLLAVIAIVVRVRRRAP